MKPRIPRRVQREERSARNVKPVSFLIRIRSIISCFILVIIFTSATHAQTPVITPKSPVVLKLNPAGTYNVSAGDVATVTNPGNVTPIVTVSPASFDCSSIGKQTVTVTAANPEANPSAVSFYGVGNVLMDPSGNLFISGGDSPYLRYIESNGQSYTLANGSDGPYSNSTTVEYGIYVSGGMARDNLGNLYIAEINDNVNFAIYELTPSGVTTLLVGTSSGGLSVDGPKGVATVYSPIDMVCDNNGNVYFTEGDRKVRKLAPDGSITTIAGSLNNFSGTQDGVGTNALFEYPQGITIDKAGNLFVVDHDAFTIRKISPAGVVTTFAGTPNIAGFIDGTGSNARFLQPSGITIDNAGNLYVVDAGNFAIRKITPAGVVTTLAGTGSPGYQDGPGNQAEFNSIYNLTVDSKGNVFVADEGNNVVREITPQGNVTTYAGSGQQGQINGNVLEGPPVSAQVPVTIEGSITIAPLPDVSLHLNSACPTALPDYTKNLSVADNCGKNINYSQSPVAGTVVTGSAPLPVTITATDETGSSNTVSFKVTPDNAPPPPPSVSISASSASACQGVEVTFTAVPANSGNNPFYQWQVNGVNAGINQPTFSTTSLSSTDVVSCKLTTTGDCPASVTSNKISVTVVTNLSPSVTITTSGNDICAGYNDQFMATAQNAGANPTFQWKLNGANVGTNSPTYANNALANGDKVSCMITNNDPSCLTTKTAASNTIPVIVSPLEKASVSITSSATGPVCNGTVISFTATPVNADGPVYVWQVNGSTVGTNSPNFSSATLADGDIVSCGMITGGKCLISPSVISNLVTVSIRSSVQTTVALSPSNPVICSGQPVTFSAQTNSSASANAFQWQVNGKDAGTNSPSFTSANLQDGDLVTCTVTPAGGCYIAGSGTGVQVKVNAVPSVSISSQLFIKPGNSIRLDPLVTGDIASYQWTPATGLDDPAARNPLASPSATTTYTLLVTSVAGCQDTRSVTVNVQGDISVPNAFTPNGDGINDVWNIASLSSYSNCSVSVYNRNGQLEFRSNGYPKPWDGTINGNPVPTGAYYYVIDLHNGSVPLSGYVTVLR